MNTININKFLIIGIQVRTTNEHNQSATDIPALWQNFLDNNIIDQIPDKTDSSIYCIYTDYEKDHTKPYTTILGCKVNSLNNIPSNMIGITIEEDSYTKYIAKGNLAEGIVYDEWLKIWGDNLPRAFTTDFEIYGEKANNRADAEVEILISLNNI
ncbi:MAG: GyrI-like domain-containing protein [Bacteroidia bacterium]